MGKSSLRPQINAVSRSLAGGLARGLVPLHLLCSTTTTNEEGEEILWGERNACLYVCVCVCGSRGSLAYREANDGEGERREEKELYHLLLSSLFSFFFYILDKDWPMPEHFSIPFFFLFLLLCSFLFMHFAPLVTTSEEGEQVIHFACLTTLLLIQSFSHCLFCALPLSLSLPIPSFLLLVHVYVHVCMSD